MSKAMGLDRRSLRLPGEDVRPSALMLHFRVWLSLGDFLDLESRRSQRVRHVFGAEELKVDLDRVSPPFVQMHDLISAVEREKQQTACTQDPFHLSQGRGNLGPS